MSGQSKAVRKFLMAPATVFLQKEDAFMRLLCGRLLAPRLHM